jgi:hypothetical protein
MEWETDGGGTFEEEEIVAGKLLFRGLMNLGASGTA